MVGNSPPPGLHRCIAEAVVVNDEATEASRRRDEGSVVLLNDGAIDEGLHLHLEPVADLGAAVAGATESLDTLQGGGSGHDICHFGLGPAVKDGGIRHSLSGDDGATESLL